MGRLTDGNEASGIDPQVAEFVRRNVEAGLAYGDMARSMTERRAIAAKIREHWWRGGPEMAETRDFDIAGVRSRLYRPSDEPGLPSLLYVHGGGWTLFSIDTHDRLMREYAARAGVAVLGVDYSLSPEAKFPVALDEVEAALGWLTANADAERLDPRCVLIGGDSAGANLSVATLLRRRDAGRPLPIGMILNYGAFDPEPTESYDLYAGPGHTLEVPEMHEFWANYVSTPDQLADPLVAPLRADLSGLPPAVMAIAERDILADCNHAFARKLAAADVPVEPHVYRGATHSFLEAVSIAAVAGRALDEQAAWIARRCAAIRQPAATLV